jgi:diadenosine tetraphosphate (Ap4A) HIT family hydrolase
MWPWNDPEHWSRLRAGEGCPLCAVGQRSDLVVELPGSRVHVPPAACLRGYVCVVHRRHVVELHDLTPDAAGAFVQEVAEVSAAVQRLTGAAKINLLSLGNLVPHLHVHVCPRRPGDRFEGRPLDPGDAVTDVYPPNAHAAYLAQLRAALIPHND